MDTIRFKPKGKEKKQKPGMAPVAVSTEAYSAICQICKRSGQTKKEVATALIEFALEHIEWEDER